MDRARQRAKLIDWVMKKIAEVRDLLAKTKT